MSHKDPEGLSRLYWDEGMSIPEIADHFDKAISTIHYHMDKNDVKRRKPAIERVPKLRVNNYGHEGWQIEEDGNGTTIQHHRLLATLKYDLEEFKDKDIHHKNGIPWDNRLENLEVKTKERHISDHAKGRERNERGQFT